MSATNILGRYAERVIAYRWLVIAGTVLVSMLLVGRIAHLQIDMDPSIWSPANHPYTVATTAVEEVFGGRHITVVGVIPKQGTVYRPEMLEKVRRIQAGLERIPQVVRSNVISLTARKAKAIRGTDQGMEVRRMLQTMPRTAAEVERLKADIAANPLYIGSLVSSDGSAAAVLADFRINKADPRYLTLLNAIHAVIDPEKDATVDIRVGGLAIDLGWFEAHMMKMPLFFGIALLIIMLVQYWCFRSIQGMLLPIVTGLFSVIWALGIMGSVGIHMDGLNTTTPILIMAVAAGHAIQILKRYYEAYHRRFSPQLSRSELREANNAAIVESLQTVGPVTLTAGAIASLTFLSLYGADISVLQHFGVFAGSGILCALALEMTFVPALRSVLRPPGARQVNSANANSVIDGGLRFIATRIVGQHSPAVLVAALVVVVLAALGAARVTSDNSIKHYNAVTSEVRRDDLVLNQKFGGTSSMAFFIEGPREDAIKSPKTLSAMLRLEAFLNGQQGVGKTESIADLVARMNKAMHGDEATFDTIPETQDLVAQYLFLYSASGDPQDFDNLVDNDYRRAVIWVFLKDDSSIRAEELHEKAMTFIKREFPPDVRVSLGGGLPQVIAINQSLVHASLSGTLQMAVVALLLAAVAFRSLIGGLMVVAPLLLVVLVNYAVMGWSNSALDMATATAAVKAIGLGADFEVYLLFRFREEWLRSRSLTAATSVSMLTAGKAIVFVALSIIAGYSVLWLSDFGFYKRLASMVLCTMVVSALTALVLLRAMITYFKPNFIFRGAAGEMQAAGASLPVVAPAEAVSASVQER